MTDFNRFALLNYNAGIMNDPMRKTAYFLGLMQGNARAWAGRASDWLQKVVEGDERPPFGYNAWQITEREFRDAFTDYAAADHCAAWQAAQDIRKLRMREGRLDDYIEVFQDLAIRAGLDLNDPTAMTMFAHGLQGTLAETCVMQDGPENFLQWAQATQKHHRNWLKLQAIKSTSPFRGNAPFQPRRPGTNPLTWRRTDNGGNAPKPRDPNPMDVDAIRKVTTEAEKEKYRAEGRCFACGRQGHISRLCPDKKPRVAASVDATSSTHTPILAGGRPAQP